MRHQLLVVPALVLLVLAPAAASAGRVGGDPAVVSTTLPVTKEKVYDALLEALSTWKIRKKSLEEGLVKTEWVQRPKGDEVYQGRIVAEFVEQGYQTALTVKHEKQKRMDDLRSPSLGGPAAQWRDWSGDGEIARAVVASVEEAFGVTDAGVPISEVGRGDKGPTVFVQHADCIVTPAVGARIAELKMRRRDLVKEVRAVDQRILDAVYGDKYEQIKPQVDDLKARKAALEGQVTAIDKEILALVVAD